MSSSKKNKKNHRQFSRTSVILPDEREADLEILDEMSQEMSQRPSGRSGKRRKNRASSSAEASTSTLEEDNIVVDEILDYNNSRNPDVQTSSQTSSSGSSSSIDLTYDVANEHADVDPPPRSDEERISRRTSGTFNENHGERPRHYNDGQPRTSYLVNPGRNQFHERLQSGSSVSQSGSRSRSRSPQRRHSNEFQRGGRSHGFRRQSHPNRSRDQTHKSWQSRGNYRSRGQRTYGGYDSRHRDRVTNERSEENVMPARDNRPERFRPNDHSERFLPNNHSERFRPNDPSERFRPNDRSERFRPNDRSERFRPNDNHSFTTNHEQRQPVDSNHQRQRVTPSASTSRPQTTFKIGGVRGFNGQTPIAPTRARPPNQSFVPNSGQLQPSSSQWQSQTRNANASAAPPASNAYDRVEYLNTVLKRCPIRECKTNFFFSRAQAKRHLRSCHSQDRCIICLRLFKDQNQSTALQDHFLTEHANNDVSKAKCLFCNQYFTFSGYYKHMCKMHFGDTCDGAPRPKK